MEGLGWKRLCMHAYAKKYYITRVFLVLGSCIKTDEPKITRFFKEDWSACRYKRLHMHKRNLMMALSSSFYAVKPDIIETKKLQHSF